MSTRNSKPIGFEQQQRISPRRRPSIASPLDNNKPANSSMDTIIQSRTITKGSVDTNQWKDKYQELSQKYIAQCINVFNLEKQNSDQAKRLAAYEEKIAACTQCSRQPLDMKSILQDELTSTKNGNHTISKHRHCSAEPLETLKGKLTNLSQINSGAATEIRKSVGTNIKQYLIKPNHKPVVVETIKRRRISDDVQDDLNQFAIDYGSSDGGGGGISDDTDNSQLRSPASQTEDSSCDALMSSLEPEIIINEFDSTSDSQLTNDKDNVENNKPELNSNNTSLNNITAAQNAGSNKSQYEYRNGQLCMKLNQGHHAYVAERIARSPRASTSAFSVPLSIPSTPRTSTSGPDLSFNEEIVQDIHYRKHKGSIFICLINNCNKEISQSSNLFYHINSVHKMIRYQCPYCSVLLTTKYQVCNHCRKSHSDILDADQSLLGEKGRNLLNLIKSVNYADVQLEEENKSALDTSGTSNGSPAKVAQIGIDEEIEINVHYKKDRSGNFICLINNCGKESGQSSNLFYHINSVHRQIRFACPFCTTKLTTKYGIINHCRKSHSGMRFDPKAIQVVKVNED